MKKTLYVTSEEFDEIRNRAKNEESMGIDPGLYWKALYPEATEIEFVVKKGMTIHVRQSGPSD